MTEYFQRENIGSQLEKRLIDVMLNTEDCLTNGTKSDLVVDHLGLGPEAAELMKSIQEEVFWKVLPEFQTAYFDWSWGVEAFESEPVKKGIGSLLLD